MHILHRFLRAGWLMWTAVRWLQSDYGACVQCVALRSWMLGLVVHLLRVGSEARGSSEQGF